MAIEKPFTSRQKAMKAVVLSSPSSLTSKTTTTTSTTSAANTSNTNMAGERSETRDSCYFPKCRKDDNCDCEMCLASINATLDLKPRSSLTKHSISKRIPRSPISYNPSITLTPISSNNPITVSPPLKSTARISFHDKIKRKKRGLGIRFMVTRLVLGLSLIFAADSGFSSIFLGVLKPALSPEIVQNLGEKSWGLQDVNERVEFLHRELQRLVNGNVSDCRSNEPLWKVDQDDLLLNSWCTLYKSTTEGVRIWGWPLQTAGLLTAGFSSRSLTILSGRVTVWSDGKLSYSIRNANETWVQKKWSASVVQLDPNTWILEYWSAGAVETSGMILSAFELLKLRLSREIRRMKHEFWLFPAFRNQYNDLIGDSFIPT